MQGSLFVQAFIYLAAAVISVPLAKRLGLGSVLGYLIAGVAIGPFALGLVGEEGADVMHFAEFGVVMMLFLVGLELRPSLLWKLRVPVLGLGGAQVLVTAGVVAAIAVALGLSWRSAIAVGLVLAGSSTALVLQTLNEKGLLKTDGGQGAFSVLLFQDIAFVPILALLPLLAVSGGHAPAAADHGHASLLENLPGWAQGLAVIGTVAAIVVGGRYLISPVFRFIAKTRLREVFTAAALLLVVGIALLMTAVGLSPALGTFVAGVVLAESEYRHELESNIEPFKGLLLGLFFIAVGASINFGLIAEHPGLMAGLVAALIAIKFAVLVVLSRVFKMGTDQGLLFSFSLAQTGEFAFVLFSFSVQANVLPPEIASPLVAVVALSMAATPLLMLINEHLIQPRFGTTEAGDREADEIDEKNRVIIAGFGRFGSVVGRLLRANGVEATVLDNDSDHVDLLRKMGFKVFYGDATRLDLLHAAGAHEARLLIIALDAPEKILELVDTTRKHFPNLEIMARAGDRADAYELVEAGVEHVYRETLDTSLRMGVDALSQLGVRRFLAHRSALIFRRHDEHSVDDLRKMRHDRKEYISRARQWIADLEETLLAEHEVDHEQRGAGWDTEGIREDVRRRYASAKGKSQDGGDCS